jgi:hypothetical protein
MDTGLVFTTRAGTSVRAGQLNVYTEVSDANTLQEFKRLGKQLGS